MDMRGNDDRSPKESGGSNHITGKNKLLSGEAGDTPDSKKPKLPNDSKEEERPSIHPLSEMEQPKGVDTLPELVGSSHPSRDVSNQVSRQLFGPAELGIRMLDETSTNFLQPSPSLITQIVQKFLVELDAGEFLFEEVTRHHQSSISENFLSCHFSADGRFLACAGHGKKVTIWNKEDSNFAITEKSHSDVITEVRFRPNHRSTMYATSSYDRTVKTWDAAYPDIEYATLNADFGYPILSLDFHPRDRDYLCCCDANDLIQLWNVYHNAYMKSFKGGTQQVRYQPRFGKLLAAASGKFINIFETENYKIRNKLEGHNKEVISICWDQTGNYIASVSEDEAHFWSAAPQGGLLHVLACKHGKFESCIFHPKYPNLVIIAGHKCLEFWIPQREHSLNFFDGGDGIFTGLATSPQNQRVASISRDRVKLWKISS
ncbi:transcriptional corepressor LEUNIG_HOMOLOG-like [Gastrolobium bilobum]|uniref:transcriptional corepressor LEUNIG_HOMOLOG-like n=1 Tax=Gastrolobium bilobum TaxID=150636 RepID=UPI002AB26315|nr:transcriptional corepressor LEUNIG_HOMOLOG-like [Gastrolobium bilobum]